MSKVLANYESEEIYRTRFSEAIWFNPIQKICIGGLGSIGSWLTFFMGRIVNSIYTYEMDLLEEHNLSGQLYGNHQIGQTKFKSIENTLSNFCPECTLTNYGEFKKGSAVLPITFTCFDSMLARKNMFESWKLLDDRELFIDGRLTAEDFWVYVVIPGREDEYEKYLFSDDEVDDLPCSFKSTTHISSMLASYMVTMYTNYISNRVYEQDITQLPFQIVFNAPLSMLTQSVLDHDLIKQ